jgi:hypothetical protein
LDDEQQKQQEADPDHGIETKKRQKGLSGTRFLN